jgi:hypothetical protein
MDLLVIKSRIYRANFSQVTLPEGNTIQYIWSNISTGSALRNLAIVNALGENSEVPMN